MSTKRLTYLDMETAALEVTKVMHLLQALASSDAAGGLGDGPDLLGDALEQPRNLILEFVKQTQADNVAAKAAALP